MGANPFAGIFGMGDPAPGRPGRHGRNPLAGMVGMAGMFGALGPLLLGVQCGFMVGQMAQGLLASTTCCCPLADRAPALASSSPTWRPSTRPGRSRADDLRFFLALREAVRSRLLAPALGPGAAGAPGARVRVGSFEVDPAAIEAKLGDVDFSDPSSFEGVLLDPDAVLGAMQSPASWPCWSACRPTTALFESYADSVVERRIGGRCSRRCPPSGRPCAATGWSAARPTASSARLLGLDPSRKAHGTAAAFCAGVVERAGPPASTDWWTEANLPTAPSWRPRAVAGPPRAPDLTAETELDRDDNLNLMSNWYRFSFYGPGAPRGMSG